MAFDFLHERRAVEVQELGCAFFDPARFFQGLQDQGLLEFGNGRAQAYALVG